MTINGDDYSSGFPSKDAAADESSDSFSDDDNDDSDSEEAESAHMKSVIRKVVEGEMDSGVRQWSIVDDS